MSNYNVYIFLYTYFVALKHEIYIHKIFMKIIFLNQKYRNGGYC